MFDVVAIISSFCTRMLPVSLVMATTTLYAQPRIETVLDSSTIFIGQPFSVQYKITNIALADKWQWPQVPDSLAHFEVLRRARPDTGFNNGAIASISQTITYTSFDSGVWRLPALSFANKAPLTNNGVLISDSPLVEVNYNLSDTSKTLKDVKAIEEAAEPVAWKKYALIVGAVLLLALLLYFLLRRNKKQPRNRQTAKDAYTTAMQALHALTINDEASEAEVRAFHTTLVQTFKQYLTAVSAVELRSKTTGDTLLLLQQYSMAREPLHQATSALRCADAVKFARFWPVASESRQQLDYMKDVIEALHQLLNQKTAA